MRGPAPPSQLLHVSYEKAGLTLEQGPVPWNADAVIVQALVKLGAVTAQAQSEFTLRLPNRAPVAVEQIRRAVEPDQARIFFRMEVPEQSTMAALWWRDRTLGQVTIPVLAADAFFQQLSAQHATVAVQWETETPACQSFVSTQAKGMIASALIAAPMSLSPLADFAVVVELGRDGEAPLVRPVQFSSSQLRARQALVSVAFPRVKQVGPWRVRWRLEQRVLAETHLRAVSAAALHRSLRLWQGRYLVHKTNGDIAILRYPPAALEDVSRLGPVFLVRSTIPGMAAMCLFEVRAEGPELLSPLVLPAQTVRLSDGPTPVAPGTFARGDLGRVKSFSLWLGRREIGKLPAEPVPTVDFTSEGGLEAPLDDFAWSPVAEEQLNDRLGKLLGE